MYVFRRMNRLQAISAHMQRPVQSKHADSHEQQEHISKTD